MKESLRDEIKKKFYLKTTGIILKSSRRDTTIVNCQFSIVNSLKYEMSCENRVRFGAPFSMGGKF